MEMQMMQLNGSQVATYSNRNDRIPGPSPIGRIAIDMNGMEPDVNCNTAHGYVYMLLPSGRTTSYMFMVEHYTVLEALLRGNTAHAIRHMARSLFDNGAQAPLKYTFHFTRLGFAVEVNDFDYPEF